MNIFLLIANILTWLAFAIHTIAGDKELRSIKPELDPENQHKKNETWTMARCGWHWVSVDLLFASIGLTLINFTGFFYNEKLLLQILAVYFTAYSLVWLLIIVISQKFRQNFIRLGQWILLLIIAGLLYVGNNG